MGERTARILITRLKSNLLLDQHSAQDYNSQISGRVQDLSLDELSHNMTLFYVVTTDIYNLV